MFCVNGHKQLMMSPFLQKLPDEYCNKGLTAETQKIKAVNNL